MKYIKIFVLSFLLLIIGCSKKDILELNKSITIDMEYPVLTISNSLNDNNDGLFIVYQDIIESSINVSQIDTSGYVGTRIKLDSKFSRINFFNLFLHSLDSVFQFSPYNNSIKLFNFEGELQKEFFIPKEYLPTTNPDNPILFLNNNVIVFNTSNSLDINTSKARIEYYTKIRPVLSIVDFNSASPSIFNLGIFPDSYIEKGRDFNDFFPKVCINCDNEIVFSFNYDNYVYIIDKNGKEIKYNCSSKHIGDFNPIPESKFSDMSYLKQYHMEQPRYTNIVYDRFHDVYLRIASHKVETDNMGHVIRSSWSIIVLDNNYKKLGETLFDRKDYSDAIIITKKEGIYIANTPSFDKKSQKLKLSLFKINK